MEAIVFEQFGGPAVLRLASCEVPEPGPGQVRLRVRAAGLNQLDWKIRNGWLEQVYPTVFPKIPGIEAAGVIDALGPGVTDLAVGDEVLALTDTGSYARYALATAAVRKPAGLDWPTAAALPVSGETALRVLGALGVKDGETLLIHGAAGAVGGIAVQLAASLGAVVIGTASPGNHGYLRSLGALPVAYGEGLVERVRALAPQGVDAVFDAAGAGVLADSVALRGGTEARIVTIADPAARELGITFSAGDGTGAGALAEVARRAAAGDLRVEVARVYPLAEAAAAQEQSATGHTRGKLVLEV
ncbi:NADP-dependent oxidoreductase [Dactylosporangium matsuzakiense]|uniref:NADPH:quinone reductase n=1 Tax=Dactylosporangium matsuzakiense TaxID=53360 RepID=A0A9W6NN59_9ACTN|nr:NADP-dependent oxidoreductase [Dactylosporangium matsuzakiense]UWZ48727.1 NADP-dependent oxidoreductase [Dactylosporangium matsuzakiense]GLL03104.1 NADPH:quinone reductase [Dactylosporangium matsuzakiense]